MSEVALGAEYNEKHKNKYNKKDWPYHKASLEPDQFKNLVNGIRNVSISLGNGEKKIRDSELKNISKVRKSIIAKKNIKKNELFSEKNLCSKRPGTGLSPMLWDEIIGKKATRNYKIDDFIKLD